MQESREHFPFKWSMQTVTALSQASTLMLSGGCAKRHSEGERVQLPRWNSRQTFPFEQMKEQMKQMEIAYKEKVEHERMLDS